MDLTELEQARFFLEEAKDAIKAEELGGDAHPLLLELARVAALISIAAGLEDLVNKGGQGE